ncbi:MAG: S1 RNA-binding domain-containing protein [Candidatus Diapherotrites archaeon]
MTEWPSPGEVVVCRVSKVLEYGVFVELLEYSGVQGFVHISQVASSWVKNIHSFAKEGQVRAGKVTNLDREKRQVDVSFTKVNPSDQRARITSWKQSIRLQKLLEQVAKEVKEPFELVWEKVAVPFQEKYGSVQEGFQEASSNEQALELIDAKYRKPLKEFVLAKMTAAVKQVQGVFELHSTASNGMEIVKNALKQAQKSVKEGEVEILYAGSGKYNVWIKAKDFKRAEKGLNAAALAVEQSMKGEAGAFSYHKLEAGK